MREPMLSNRIAHLVEPPRWVPFPVVCRTMLGIVGILGAIFFIVGMLFTWLFIGDFRPIDEWQLSRSTTTARATVTQVAGTGATENDMPVYEYHFTFTTPDEQSITARSYSTGQLWSVDERVIVQYLPDKPTVARLENTRRSQFGPLVLFVLLFPTVGAILFAVATVGGLRRVILLRQGEVASAQAISVQATGARVNNQPVMKYTYEFQTWDGQTYPGASKALASGEIGDENEEPVLYLPTNPYQSVLVDALPLRCSLDVDDAGQWVSYESVWPVVWYALIWAGILVNVGFGLLRVLGVF
jgi:hypothetical protein